MVFVAAQGMGMVMLVHLDGLAGANPAIFQGIEAVAEAGKGNPSRAR